MKASKALKTSTKIDVKISTKSTKVSAIQSTLDDYTPYDWQKTRANPSTTRRRLYAADTTKARCRTRGAIWAMCYDAGISYYWKQTESRPEAERRQGTRCRVVARAYVWG